MPRLQKMALEDAHRLKRPCILCQRMTRDRQIFIPFKSEEWGGVSGKQRCFIYALCDKHDPNDLPTDLKIDATIRQKLQDENLESIVEA